jgi:hypothetical protein
MIVVFFIFRTKLKKQSACGGGGKIIESLGVDTAPHLGLHGENCCKQLFSNTFSNNQAVVAAASLGSADTSS